MRLPPIPAIGRVLRPGPGALVREGVAGITLAALCLPLNIGYAQAAGLPASVGIYSAMIPLGVFALTSGSRHLMVGPDATIAALLAVVIPGLAADTGASPTDLAMGAALLTGVVLLLAWLLRIGRFVRFLSKAVLIGFIAGLAIEVLTSQVEKIMNVDVHADGWLPEVWELVKAVPDASGASVVIGLVAIAIVRILPRFTRTVPASLVALAVTAMAVALLDPEGVELIGDVPSGLPQFALPGMPLEAWSGLAATAVAIAALTIAESLLIARNAARQHGEDFDDNAEVFALSAVNLAGAVTVAMPSGASASRSAAVGATGSRTQIPSIVAAVTVCVILLVAPALVENLPDAALAGLVASAALSLIEVKELRHLASVRRTEAYIAVGCAIGVLALGPMAGIAIAAIVSAIDVVRRTADAPWTRPALRGDRTGLLDETVGVHDDGLVILRPGGALFFANADLIEANVESAIEEHHPRWVVLDLQRASDVDPTAAEAIGASARAAVAAGARLALCGIDDRLRVLLDRYGLVEEIGVDHLFVNSEAAISAFRSAG